MYKTKKKKKKEKKNKKEEKKYVKTDLNEQDSSESDSGDDFELATSSWLVHGDVGIERNNGDLAPPIHLATSYINGNDDGYSYIRAHNKTRSRVEKVLGKIEGGYAMVYPSGSAATLAALFHYKPRRIWVHMKGYQGTHGVIETYLKQNGSVDEWMKRKKLLQLDSVFEKDDLIWLEAPRNPTCEPEDIELFVQRAHSVGAFVCVDATFASPIVFKPLDFGADMVMHSATKFLGGHSDVLAGVLVAKSSGVRAQLYRDRITLGLILGNLENYLLLRSLRTLEIRVERQSKNALEIAKYLATEKRVVMLHYPSIESSQYYELAKKYFKLPVPILAFELATGELAERFMKKLKVIHCATSLGGFHTTIDLRKNFDPYVADGLMRLSVGIEDPQDIIKDLQRAFKRAFKDLDLH